MVVVASRWVVGGPNTNQPVASCGFEAWAPPSVVAGADYPHDFCRRQADFPCNVLGFEKKTVDQRE